MQRGSGWREQGECGEAQRMHSDERAFAGARADRAVRSAAKPCRHGPPRLAIDTTRPRLEDQLRRLRKPSSPLLLGWVGDVDGELPRAESEVPGVSIATVRAIVVLKAHRATLEPAAQSHTLPCPSAPSPKGYSRLLLQLAAVFSPYVLGPIRRLLLLRPSGDRGHQQQQRTYSHGPRKMCPIWKLKGFVFFWFANSANSPGSPVTLYSIYSLYSCTRYTAHSTIGVDESMMVKPLSCSTLKSSVRGLDVIANHKTLVTAFAKPETGRQKTT